ncbi:MAG TPA: hypothetical protein VGS96_03760 [Thermoanaerobaculia bacterium]|jgi:hypothetical protein|nr:hypothetical protein [Thermoanaerobaculia bacterium]
MDPRFRRPYNEQFTQERYDWFQRELARRLSCTFEFRLAETPVFLTDDFKARAVKAAKEIVEQLSDPTRLTKMKQAIPKQWDTPGMDALPSVAQVDFAIVASDGTYSPKLIELQGFPSLTALQVAKRDVYHDMMQSMRGLDRWWSCWFSGFDRDQFLDLARRTIVGKHDPHEVILMDIDPPTQKTYPDFAATKLMFDVDAVDPTHLVKRGQKLFRPDGTPVRRIYNRIVFDELINKKIALPFDYREELDIEWVPHPNWYWTWSKYSLPFLDHPAVPKATFISDLDRVPADLSRYVLKPLFSFAGGGVNVDPTPNDIAAIPAGDRHAWCIQEKIEYAPAIQAADGGGVKAEIRMMFFRPDDEPKPILGQNLARLSRGKLLGVDFNKAFTWVGSSVALSPSS